jgi:predicted alpha/beta superfamily hydrolase
MFGLSPLPTRVLYVLDADLCFGAAVETTRLMHQLYGELPPVLVVGVGYGADDPRIQSQLRNRDFTPTSVAEYEQMIAQMGVEPVLPPGQRLGKAAQFLAFLREEVRPFVEQRFGVSGENSILFGSSLGGLFALWTFLTAPDSFANYIAASPAIWWDDELLFKLEAGLSGADIDAGLFLGVGELEEHPALPMLAKFKMVSNVARMQARLAMRNYPSLRMFSETIAGESHTSVIVPALTRGLRRLVRRT